MKTAVYPVILSALLAAGCQNSKPVEARQSAGPVAVNVASVGVRQIQRVVESVGTLYPYDEVTISAEVEGPVEKVTADLGDAVSASPATGKEKWTNAFSGMKKIGALVGKRLNAAGAVAKKWFLVGAQANDVGQDFPTEDYYKRSMSFDVDYFTVADLS